ncbi:MAG: glycosyltransferase [Candidatus Freyarchaeota archaeon]|nr:glycosyltransferase [Candidatus Freyrarchaeum guaymaensis]HDO81293.1 glycosyltransferase [Candidatus Bathyarchaeota archaeon]
MTHPLFSVVIPTYNEERYLPLCLNSVLNQTMPREKYEIIIVDGYSEDNTVKIAEEKADKVILSEKRGPGDARNKGGRAARGKILLFLDADTVISRSLMEKVYVAFSDPRVVGGTCDIYPLERDSRGYALYSTINLLYRVLYAAGFPHAQTKCCFYLRKTFLEAGGFKETLIVAEDQELAWRMSRKGRMVYVKDAAAYSSMRRERSMGYARVTWEWVKNYLMALIMETSQRVWEPIR